MPNFTTPGVYTFETDNSNYSPSISGSIVAVVGFAKKGPTNVATLITSPETLIATFGEPDQLIYGQGVEAALELLEVTDVLYFIRCVGETAALDASATIKVGGCPAVRVEANAYGVTEPLYITAQVYDNNGVAQYAFPKTFSITSGLGDTQGEALRTVFGGALDSDKIGAFYTSTTNSTGYVVGSFAGSGAYMELSAYEDSDLTTPTAALEALDIEGTPSAGVSSVAVYGSEVNSAALSGVGYLVESIYPGEGYNNGTKSDGTTSGNSVTVTPLGGHNTLLQVNENGSAKETFKVSLVASGAFVEDIINTGETNLASYIIKGNVVENLSDIAVTKIPDFTADLSTLNVSGLQGQQGGGASVSSADELKFVKFIQGTYGLANGTNGIPAAQTGKASALIGDAGVTPKTGLQALDDESLNISLALVPGVTDQNVQNALITLAENTGSFMALVAPPYAVGSVQDAIDWSNGQKPSRTAAISSSYAAVHWPWLKVFSTFEGADVWYDPSIFGARQMVHTDNVSETWFAPAGFSRGRLTKPTEVEVKLNAGDRQSLYSGGNIINPIVNFEQNGITIFGQRTSQRTASYTDRINVRRLLIHLNKLIKATTLPFSFEPSDPILWEKIESTVNPLLQDIKVRRGIRAFNFVCDETTNTPVRIDRGELWCRVEIQPTRAAEVLVFELNITNQVTNLEG